MILNPKFWFQLITDQYGWNNLNIFPVRKLSQNKINIKKVYYLTSRN